MNYTIRPSASYVAMLAAAHLTAIASVCYANLPRLAQAASSLLLLLNFAYLVRGEMRGQAWRSFTLQDRSLRVLNSDGKTLDGELSADTLVTPFCVVLCARLDGAQLRRVIFFDAMPPEDFRELRVRLRYAWPGQ